MTPAPTLQDLIDAVRADSPGPDALALLAQAARTVADLEQVGDAVLGHFVDQCRRSGHSWSEISTSLGVTKQAAHKRFSLGATPFERFTPRARAVLERAAEEARRLGHASVGTEHLLLALFTDAGSLAAKTLAEVGVTRDRAEAELMTLVEPGTSTTPLTRPFTPGVLEALRGAVEEALSLGHNYIGTEHLLLCLFRDPDSAAARVLRALGADRDRCTARIEAHLATLRR